MSKAGRGGRRTSDFGYPSARSTVGRRTGSPPKQRPSGLFGGDAAYNTASSPPVGPVPSHGDRFAESLPRNPKTVLERLTREAPGTVPSAPATVPGRPGTSAGRGGITLKRLGSTFGNKRQIQTRTLPAPALAEAKGMEAPSLPAPQATHAMHSLISPKATTPG
jgi:hypothetical protein